MRFQTILVCFFVFTFFHCASQTKNKLVIVETIDKKDYFYIPKSALRDSVQGILHQNLMDQRTSPEKRPIKLYWGTECTDGSYDLTITPEQIFFSSSHPNPNPDQLFWVIEIDTFQFGQIRKMLKKGAPDGFEKIANGDPRWQILFYDNQFKDTYKIPAEWTHQELQQFESYCKLQIQKQLEKYTLILNSCIDDPMKKVVFPTQDDPMGMKPKYFSEFMYDLQDWGQFQTKFEPPKILKIK